MKKNRNIFFLVSAILIFILASCKPRGLYKPTLFFGASEMSWVEKTLRKMSLEEKIGQMIACSYSGQFVNTDSDTLQRLKHLIAERKIGSLVLFGGQVYETAFLTNAVQKMAKIPLLIASDFERGAGNQIQGAVEFPPLMAIGATCSEEQAYRMGEITALEGRAVGVHMTYAPVADVNINSMNPIINTRSIGEDPQEVSRLATAFIRGCQENGLIATAKHFPGHGDTDQDSHSVLPTVSGDRSRLEKVELYPFKKAIEAGVQAIMTAHLQLPALDSTPNLPATLSPLILTGLLREELGFKGLIVTDSMGMGGVTSLYSPQEAALKAVQAGVDIVLLPPAPDEVIDSLVQAVKLGQISEARISASVRRILEAKARLGLHKTRLVDVGALNKRVATKENLELARQMHEKAITLVKNNGGIIPLSGLGQKIAIFSLSSDPDGYFAGRPFVQQIEKRSSTVFSFYADSSTGADLIQEAAQKAIEADVIVVALFSTLRAWKGSVDLEPKHIEFVKQAAADSAPVVVISFGSPYFLKHFPDVDCYICAYRWTPQVQEAVAKALFGEIDITGRLPVSLPGLYPLGHGLSLFRKNENAPSFE
jgi:beta-N-acetylhexosaminidase